MFVAAQAGSALDAEVRRLRTLYKLLDALSKARGFDDVHEAALTSLVEGTRADRAAIIFIDEHGAVRSKASPGLSSEFQAAVMEQFPWTRTAREGSPMVAEEAFAAENARDSSSIFQQEGIRAVAIIPLTLEAGMSGELMLCYAENHEGSEDELEMASAIAAHVAVAIEHKRSDLARKALERAGQHLAAIVSSSDDAIVSKDLNGIITSWNRGAERIFGYSSAEALGRPVAMLAAPDCANEMPDILSQIRQGRRVEHYETRRRRKDGEIIDVALTVSPVRDGSGQIIGASKIARDITDRRRAEEERALLHAREQEARRIAELLNRVGPRLAAQLDLKKLAQEVTDIATALVGAEFGSFFHNATNEEGESYTLHALSGLPSEALENFPVLWNADVRASTFHGGGIVRSEDVTQDPRYCEELEHQAAAGKHTVRSYLAAPVVARSSEFLGGLFLGHSLPGQFTEAHEAMVRGIAAQAGIAMDNARLFEEGQRIQTELKRANEDLKRANRDLEAFAYSASHDLQEPLRNIAISAQLLERSSERQPTDENAIFLTNILKASERMKTLIDDLLAYTVAMKHEAGPAPSVDSGRVLADVLEGMRALLDEAGATVDAGELPMVAIHQSRLSRLFQNLISNAIKYRSKEPPYVRIEARHRDGWSVFSVTDNGMGIEAQYAEQIFGLFKRLHGGDYPGSGIGLAICQRVLEHYGGRIWLERSEPGAGSTFCFAIPMRAASTECEPEAGAPDVHRGVGRG